MLIGGLFLVRGLQTHIRVCRRLTASRVVAGDRGSQRKPATPSDPHVEWFRAWGYSRGTPYGQGC